MRTSVEQAQGGRFVVGVDFGTTFCSVAFAHSISPDQVKVVITWPNNRTGTADDVPTEIQYANSETREHSWGYSIPKGRRQVAEPLKWFKLLLQEDPSNFTKHKGAVSVNMDHLVRSFDQALSNFGGTLGDIATSPAVKTSAQLRQLGLRPVDVIQDFLCSVRKIVHESMENTYHRAFVNDSNVEYVLTIPAIWSDSAKALMVSAAQKAGYGQHRVDFHLVSEPEAAAAYTLKVIQPNDFKEDDTFIICDAGGGTVDLISYKVQSLDPLRVDEVVGGTGDLCGSVYLDSGFRAYMERRVGKATLDKMKLPAQNAMDRSWEEVKCSFGPDNGYGDEFDVNVPGLLDNEELDIQEGFHSMAREDVEKIFDPVVARVIGLVKGQVDKVEKAGHRVSAIILVGGFGSSAYLFERLKAEQFSSKPGKVQVIQPVNARTAIARGAVVRGLDGSIVREKRARRSYGIIASIIDYPAVAAHKRYFDLIEGVWRVPGGFCWYLNKGDVLRQDKSTTMRFSKCVPVSEKIEIQLSIMATEQDDAPDFDWEDHSEAFEVCKLNADFSCVSVNSLQRVGNKFLNNGEGFYKIGFSIELTIQDDVLKFELVHKGKKYGEVETKYQ